MGAASTKKIRPDELPTEIAGLVKQRMAAQGERFQLIVDCLYSDFHTDHQKRRCYYIVTNQRVLRFVCNTAPLGLPPFEKNPPPYSDIRQRDEFICRDISNITIYSFENVVRLQVGTTGDTQFEFAFESQQSAEDYARAVREQMSNANSAPPAADVAAQLEKLARLYRVDKLITQEEYEAAKLKLLG